jgi:uroporphyrinogen III methyltransferase/synthase
MQATSIKPLSRVRILVTRPTGQAQTLSEKLRELGATTIELPTIQIVRPENTDSMDTALMSLRNYDWVIFTSVHGIQFFMKRMGELKVAPETFKMVRVAAIGPATAAALELAVKKPDFIPQKYLSEKIVDGLGDVKGKRILLPRADIASNKLPALLRERGAAVDEVVAYWTIIPRELTPERLKSVFAEGVDLVTFTSPSTIRSLAAVMGGEQLEQFLRKVKVACIGPVTLEAAKELGIDVDIVAETHTIDALVKAIVDEIGTL